MSTLMVLVSLSLAGAACSGAEADVPARFIGWPEADVAWLEQELTRWVSDRDRRLCVANEGAPGLTLQLEDREVTIRFDFKGTRYIRTASRSGPLDELLRYQVAATAEELVRSTWEAPPPPRFAVLLRAEFSPLGTGPLCLGGSLGAALFLVPSLSVELAAGGAVIPPRALSGGATVSGELVQGSLSLSWLPLRLGVLRAGPRASVQGGALTVRVMEPEAATITGTTPWLSLGAGGTVGLEFRHTAVQLAGEVGSALMGATVLSEGRSAQTVRGLRGTFSVQAGWQW